jgi:tetratricopeptide (TPR) repeat protein
MTLKLSFKFKRPILKTLAAIVTLALGFIATASEELPEEYAELMALVEQEKHLIGRLDDDLADKKLDAEIQMRIDEIGNSYEQYIERYPNSVFAKLIFGKFLRKTDQSERANQLFLSIHEEIPDIPVVNQQLALHASETGDYATALHFFRKTIELDPKQALYHYQFGEFLYTYKTSLMQGGRMPISEIEAEMNQAFAQAHRLEPNNRDFHLRWAESYFDLFNPDWTEILPEWYELMESSQNSFEKDVIRLQTARVLIQLKKYFDAEQLINEVDDPALVDSVAQVRAMLP